MTAKKIFVYFLIFAWVLNSGCATIMHGTSQDILITSTPSLARISLNHKNYGLTPSTVSLKRNGDYSVTLDKDGYREFNTQISSSWSAWLFGNILFGGLIGLIVDGFSGGYAKLAPESINAELISDGGAGMPGQDYAYRMGNYLYGEKRYAQAAEYYKTAVRAQVRNEKAWVYLGNCYYFIGIKTKALFAYSCALQLEPSNTTLRAFVEHYRRTN